MKKINKFVFPLIAGLTCLASCKNDQTKKHTVNLYDYSSSSCYTEYSLSSSTKIKEGDVFEYPKDPSRKSFRKFIGWTLDKEHTEFYDFNKPVTSDIKLYANYAKEDERVLHVDYDDGVYRWGIHKKGDVINNVPSPSTREWDFKEWYLNKSLSLKAKFPLTMNDDVYLYAQYKKHKIPVYYHYNGGIASKTVQNVPVEYGECAKYFIPPESKREKFVCWCTDNTLETEYDFTTRIYEEGTELWGKWKKVQS